MYVGEHFEAETIYELLDGRLDASEARRIEAHLTHCGACRALREECGALRNGLRWYGIDPPSPPAGYWDEFWDRWPVGERRIRVATLAHRTLPALALAASVALLISVWRTSVESPDDLSPTSSVPVVAQADWSDEYEFFEQVTVAVGSVDPMSKGVVLASMAEAP